MNESLCRVDQLQIGDAVDLEPVARALSADVEATLYEYATVESVSRQVVTAADETLHTWCVLVTDLASYDLPADFLIPTLTV